MDLVDEQHVAVVEVGEDGGEVAGAFERGPAGDPQADVHLGGDDPRQGGLAEAGRTGEEEVVGGLPATARGAEEDLEVLLQPRLADELVEAPGPEGDLLGLLDRIGRRAHQLVLSLRAVTARSFSASRRSVLDAELLDRAVRELRDDVAHLVGGVAEARERGAHLGARRAVRHRSR